MINRHTVQKLTGAFQKLPAETSVYFARYEQVDQLEQLLGQPVQEAAAIVDASLVISEGQILAAVYKALGAQLNGQMRLKSLYAEIIFNLAPNNNISQSLKTFGIQGLIEQRRRSIVVIAVGLATRTPAVFDLIQGQITSFPAEPEISDDFEKVYKSRDLSLVISKIAAKSYL